MRKGHYTVASKDVHEHAAGLIEKHVGLKKLRGKCTGAVLLHVLFAAAARLASPFAACAQMRKAPSPETARQALLAALPAYGKLQQGVNRALVGDLPKPLRKRQQRIAIDLHLTPYYGAAYADPKEIYRGQNKAGTNSFHAYASAYVAFHGQRFTVALTPVERNEDMKVIVQRLLTLARKGGVRPALLLLDRGFYSIAVIRYLQCARVPFLLPAVARGRKPGADTPATGIRAYKLWKRGGWGQHTLVTGKKKATVSICVHCGNYRGRGKNVDAMPGSTPIGASGPDPPVGSGKRTAVALASRRAIGNCTKRASKPARAIQQCGISSWRWR
jgi:hypothetical protein